MPFELRVRHDERCSCRSAKTTRVATTNQLSLEESWFAEETAAQEEEQQGPVDRE